MVVELTDTQTCRQGRNDLNLSANLIKTTMYSIIPIIQPRKNTKVSSYDDNEFGSFTHVPTI